MECQCVECTKRREFAKRIDEIKEELRRTSPGFEEFDWVDLERQSIAARERERGAKPNKRRRR